MALKLHNEKIAERILDCLLFPQSVRYRDLSISDVCQELREHETVDQNFSSYTDLYSHYECICFRRFYWIPYQAFFDTCALAYKRGFDVFHGLYDTPILR
jgi:hypothetical protein